MTVRLQSHKIIGMNLSSRKSGALHQAVIAYDNIYIYI